MIHKLTYLSDTYYRSANYTADGIFTPSLYSARNKLASYRLSKTCHPFLTSGSIYKELKNTLFHTHTCTEPQKMLLL